jgi:KDO2-lipid IV(A) lauroyltransferase
MLVALFKLLSLLPLPILHGIGTGLGWLVYLSSPTYRQRLRENMRLAGVETLIYSAVPEAGKSILELAFIWCAPQEKVLKKAKIQNWDLVQSALDMGDGVIFLTPHLGCFEIIAQAIATRINLTVLYRPPHKKALQPLIETARARANLLLAPANLGGVRTLLKALKKGNSIGLLPDQVPQNGEGVWANFFGKPAYTMTLSAKLHSMTGARIICAYAERLPWGKGYLINFVPFTDDLKGTPEHQANSINCAMENLIAFCPAQYAWSYNRYKTPDHVASYEATTTATPTTSTPPQPVTTIVPIKKLTPDPDPE